ncbi:hypothetical protein EY643_16880 [Halioglobus maricola]|uniref:Prokaryotic cytochrome C oxidase subunit IV family protein n=1 Tax=Halioglobus maricola TaxID=2601894 RepID=A0A5P9NN28_9GAMM|nr:cytochrome C oxidase subunit IV family protein [Halioglobus maricola]QFU77197.1 hypothetical protein EY643_16880 [Halioglobus maricola]
MKTIIFTRITAVWLILVAATLLSWGIDQGQSQTFQFGGAAILAIALIKVRFVIQEFMEVRTAPFILKAATDIWCVAVFILLTALLLQS